MVMAVTTPLNNGPFSRSLNPSS